ncbi:MAG: tetratricopeptide repeat protein [Ignavibacteriae bacterium]|nr:MAG: tetratricopeptide repeat protein [Ignavibacteriota bacterium]
MLKKLTITSIFAVFIYIFSNPVYSQELTAQEIFEKVNDAIVVIVAYDFEGKPMKQGSGVVINDSGIIITNYHVFSKCEKIAVYHNKEFINYFTIEAADIEKDILILKVNEKNFKTIAVGNSENVKVGEKIYAIGSPMGYENTISEGIVSGIRSFDEDTYIQISASISQGSSGGAIINSKGELVGISTFQVKEGQNLNFAIPINEIFSVRNEYLNNPQLKESNDYFFKGYNAYLAKNYKETLFYYTAYLKILPNSAIGYYNRALAYKKLEQYEDALKDLNMAIELEHEDTDALIARGNLYNELGKYKEALEDYNTAISIDSEDPYGYKGRGETYLYTNNYQSALNDFNKAISLDDSYIEVYYDRGRTYSYLGDDMRAIQDLSVAIEMFPKYYGAYLSRARAYNNLKEYEKAKEDFVKCIELNPDEQIAYNNFGWMLFENKEYKLAIASLSKSFELDNEDWDALLGMSLTMYIMNENDDAEKILKAAIKIEPKLKKGMQGLKLLEDEGYTYTKSQKKLLEKFFEDML